MHHRAKPDRRGPGFPALLLAVATCACKSPEPSAKQTLQPEAGTTNAPCLAREIACVRTAHDRAADGCPAVFREAPMVAVARIKRSGTIIGAHEGPPDLRLPPQDLWLQDIRNIRGQLPAEIAIQQTRGIRLRPEDVVAIAAGYHPAPPILAAAMVFGDGCDDLATPEALARTWSGATTEPAVRSLESATDVDVPD